MALHEWKLSEAEVEVLNGALDVRSNRATQRREMWRDDGALVHLMYAMGKMRRVFQACTSGDLGLAQAVWRAEEPDILNYFLFAAQLMREGDLYGDWPWSEKGED